MKINLDSPVIVFLTTVADFMILNILFILCCAPVITIGPAVSALYTITMREARHEGGYIFKPFFKAFKNNFKQAFLLSILYLIRWNIPYVRTERKEWSAGSMES